MRVAIVGTGNIGTDLMEKLRRSPLVDLALFAGIDRDSPGVARAQAHGIPTATDGIETLLNLADSVDLVYEATSASIARSHADAYRDAGVRLVDLTPAKLGPPVVPAVNIRRVTDETALSLITCGGQATIPIVAAVASATPVLYAEIVSTIASLSAGPGTRQNIDEFTVTTGSALVEVGEAQAGKAIIILNPGQPPMLMRNTVHCLVQGTAAASQVTAAVVAMVSKVQAYVPGYRLVAGPEFDGLETGEIRVSTFLEVEGAGDFLPPYAGNLDIMTAAAVAVAEALATDGVMGADA
jgi:acetaldehyde dehydrogenase